MNLAIGSIVLFRVVFSYLGLDLLQLTRLVKLNLGNKSSDCLEQIKAKISNFETSQISKKITFYKVDIS